MSDFRTIDNPGIAPYQKYDENRAKLDPAFSQTATDVGEQIAGTSPHLSEPSALDRLLDKACPWQTISLLDPPHGSDGGFFLGKPFETIPPEEIESMQQQIQAYVQNKVAEIKKGTKPSEEKKHLENKLIEGAKTMQEFLECFASFAKIKAEIGAYQSTNTRG